MPYLHRFENDVAKILIVLVHCVQFLYASPEANFAIFKGYSYAILENSYLKIAATSAIVCCRLCLNGECVAINYREISDECEMLDGNQFVDAENPNTVYSSGLFVYVRDGNKRALMCFSFYIFVIVACNCCICLVRKLQSDEGVCFVLQYKYNL